TQDTTILIDPSVSLAPFRFGKKPHALEVAASWISRQTILKAAEKADVIIQTHYHADHFTLGINRMYEFTNQAVFNSIYSLDKIILAKDPEEKLNYRQRKRAYWLWKKKGLSIHKADGKTFEIKSTNIIFSPPVKHGIDEKRGYVVETLIKDSNESYLFSSDICGPATHEATDFIIQSSPDIAVIDGPTSYHPKVTEEEKEAAFAHLGEIADNISKVYIDHHFLRTLNWEEILKETIGKVIPPFSQIQKQAPTLLEAQRTELHKQHPVKEEFYEELRRGVYSEQYLRNLLKEHHLLGYWTKIGSYIDDL
ncbi:MAG: MBL fold metallo-hydrolase, partial [Candidatus Heimdallarchaeaceae archaeon]